jgi:hypothetical protein
MPTIMQVEVLTLNEAQDLLRHCLGSGGTVIPGRHFRDELRAEDLTLPAAWHVLRTGCIYNAPEHDIGTGEWKYTVEGHEPEGKWVVIVFCFKTADRAFLITVFSVEARRKP